MSKLLRTYLTVASFVLMTITSMGAASYLSTNFQKSSLPVKTLEVKVKSMTEEKVKLEARKKEIDAQIANLPADYVKGRTKLLNNFKTEIERINDRIVQLDVEVPKVQTEMIDATSHAGPIMYLATALKSTPELAMGWLIGLMIFVFDPLAVALILAGNYLVAQRTYKEIKAPLLPIPVEELIEDIPETDLPNDMKQNFEDDGEFFDPFWSSVQNTKSKEEDYNPQYFWNDYPKDVNESHTDLELEPLEDRDEESIEEESVMHEENEDPDKNFYPYFSPGMVEQAKSVAKLPDVEEVPEEEPTIHSSLNEVHIPSEHIVQFDNSLPSQNVKHYTSNTYL